MVSRALMDAALEFAGYLHRNAEPMFLHSLRAFFEYQDYACAGCKASTALVTQQLAMEPPTNKQLATLIAQNAEGDDVRLGEDELAQRLMEAMGAIQAGASVHEALEAVGGRAIINGENE